MGVIIFNGISSQDYCIQVEKLPDYETPERDYHIVHVPGKNGDILIDKGSYKNVMRKYQIAVGAHEGDFTLMANTISEWLHASIGYARLEDSYEPEYYRIAMYQESGVIENLLGFAGRTTISFNCKPQRFLKFGDHKLTFESNGILKNPTGFKSNPVIVVNGNGSGNLSIGNYSMDLTDINPSITINSEIQDIYNGTINMNSFVSLINGFPKLNPGESELSFSGGITSVEVVPKWWTL